MKHLIVAAILIGSAFFAGCGGAGDVPAELKAAESSVPESESPGAAASADANLSACPVLSQLFYRGFVLIRCIMPFGVI